MSMVTTGTLINLKLHTCSWDIPEDGHQADYNESNYPTQNLAEKRGEGIFSKGVY